VARPPVHETGTILDAARDLLAADLPPAPAARWTSSTIRLRRLIGGLATDLFGTCGRLPRSARTATSSRVPSARY
jgi:hypothetical protein